MRMKYSLISLALVLLLLSVLFSGCGDVRPGFEDVLADAVKAADQQKLKNNNEIKT